MSAGPPPLQPFGLVLHHDGRWSHEGEPIRNTKLREHFDRSVQFLPDEGKYIVTLRHFRGEIIVEEAGFFVRDIDLASGELCLSDGSREPLHVSTLRLSDRDEALLCSVKAEFGAGVVLARFMPAAHAELMQAVEERDGVLMLRIAGAFEALPSFD